MSSPQSEALDLSSYDAWLFLTLGSTSFFLSLLLIIGFLKYHRLRERPGDLVLMISISGLFLSLHWVLTALFSGKIFVDLSNEAAFCKPNAFISVTCGAMTYLYNLGFCIYLVTSLRNALKDSRIPNKSLHGICIGASVAFAVYKAVTGGLGKSLFGTCSLKFEPDKTAASEALKYIGLVFFYFLFACYTYWYIRSRQPKNLNSKSMRKSKIFLSHYLKFLFANFVIWLAIGISYFLGIWFPPKGHDTQETRVARYIASIGNIAKMLSISVVLFIRFTDPIIARTMKKVVLFCRRRRRIRSSISTDASWGTSSRRRLDSASSDIDVKEVHPINEYKGSVDSLKEPLIHSSRTYSDINGPDGRERGLTQGFANAANELANDLKIQTTITILSSVLYSYKSIIEEDVTLSVTQLMEDGEGFLKPKKFTISNSLVPQVTVPLLDGMFMFHCPYVFHHLLRQDSDFLDIEESLDIDKNKESIQRASGADGGRSGEFFFFSSDNKIIVKTMTEKELVKMIEILPSYIRHMEENPKSLIAKIYGVFTFRREFDPHAQHFFVMRNATGVPPSFIPRRYDTKGSTIDREVLVNRHFIEKQFINETRTLKDLDFLKYEKKLNVAEDLREQLIANLEKDADFLRRLNLMDYSLVIFVINRKRVRDDLGSLPKSACYHELCSLEDCNDPDLGYNIAIIDYLQEYDCKKLLENRLKRAKAGIFKCNWSIDISSQPSDIYANRFKGFVRTII